VTKVKNRGDVKKGERDLTKFKTREGKKRGKNRGF